MVDQTDLISTHQQLVSTDRQIHPLRWLKHFLYMPWRTRHYFNQIARDKISEAVRQAEQGHAGEIQVIIEGHLPLALALTGNTQLRARQLFAEYGVWDTAYNSGILLYINICEKRVEIVADRGIHAFVEQDCWQKICNHISQQLGQNAYLAGVLLGIHEIGITLDQFYAYHIKDLGNELNNNAIIL